MKKLFILISVVMLTLTSCHTKQSAINDLRALNQEMQINGQNFTINDWTNASKDYYKINKRISRHAGEYTDAEVQEISSLNGQCMRSFTEGAVTKVQGAANAVKSFIGGFLK